MISGSSQFKVCKSPATLAPMPEFVASVIIDRQLHFSRPKPRAQRLAQFVKHRQ
jgi:hypothetical protein